MRVINKNSPIPIYYQLKNIILEMIDNEELKPLSAIPTERELCDLNGISRMTARTAIMALVNEGVLFRERGKGTFVAAQEPAQQQPGLKGLKEDMEQMGHKVETKIISFSLVESKRSVANVLQLNDSQQVFELKRLRIVDNVPYAIETVWLDPARYNGLTKEDIEVESSLYKVLRERYSLIPYSAKQTVEPIKLNEYEKEQFDLEGESLALLFHRTTYTAEEEVMEFTKGVYRIDKHKYEICIKA